MVKGSAIRYDNACVHAGVTQGELFVGIHIMVLLMAMLPPALHQCPDRPLFHTVSKKST